jgi:WhiB family redox-sensing transcriptional regulator
VISIDKLIPDWHAKAVCNGMDDVIFFGDSDSKTRPALTLTQLREAQAICNTCPVFRNCLTHALEEREVYGIWAGTSRRSRLKLFEIIDREIVTLEDIVEGYCDGKGYLYEQFGRAL